MILVSAPGSAAPGLYQWKSGVVEPKKICVIDSPSSFSFNRRIVIERVPGEHDSLRLYHAGNCALLGTIETTGRVIDVDAREGLIAVAMDYGNEERALELYSMRGNRLASTSIGRNVELGFAPDGKALLNFDLSDAADAMWSLPALGIVKAPSWMKSDELAFVPGAHYVKRYAKGALTIAHWPSGKPKYVIPTGRTVRVRQLSRYGRFGVTHERLPDGDLIERFDFSSGKRTKLDIGSIDHATISADGRKVAWSQRGGLSGEDVTILRAEIRALTAVRTAP